MTAPAVPKAAGPAGRRLWRALKGLYEFEAHQLMLLREAVRLTAKGGLYGHLHGRAAFDRKRGGDGGA